MSATAPPPSHPVIALVASVGGLDAVSRILSKLPATLDAAMLVLIHQAPDQASVLAEILGRRCAMPVAVAEHDGALAPGTVVVVPPGRHLLITARQCTALIVSGSAPPSRPSADLLLATMATALGPRAIAVVLSGGGHDGATGATAVHRLGGTVLASDRDSSSTFSMPLATIERDHAIDAILDLDEIAAHLVALVTSAEPPGG